MFVCSYFPGQLWFKGCELIGFALVDSFRRMQTHRGVVGPDQGESLFAEKVTFSGHRVKIIETVGVQFDKTY